MANIDDPPPPYVQAVAKTWLGGSPEERDARAASMPSVQFRLQADLEKKRIYEHFRPGRKLMKSLPMDPDYGINKLVFHNLKARWIGWGIWDDNWEVAGFFGHWMHEEIAPEAKGEPPHISYRKSPSFPRTTNPGFRYTKKPTDSTILDKSRPINQFWSQVAHERLYLEETGFHDSTDQTRAIDEEAQGNVRRRWIRQKLWSKQWRDVPGDTWDHESASCGLNLKWFYKQHPFRCSQIADIARNLPADEDMSFRRVPEEGTNWNLYVGQSPPKIVPCNCMSPKLRKALWEQPCAPVSELRIRNRTWPSETPLSLQNQQHNEGQGSSQLEQNSENQQSSRLKQNSENQRSSRPKQNSENRRSSRPKQNSENQQSSRPKQNSENQRSSRLKQNTEETLGSLRIKHNNVELRRSSRLMKKRGQPATPRTFSKPVVKSRKVKPLRRRTEKKLKR